MPPKTSLALDYPPMSTRTPERNVGSKFPVDTSNEKVTDKTSKTPAAAGQTKVVTPDETPQQQRQSNAILSRIDAIPISFPNIVTASIPSQVADLQQQVSTLTAKVATQAAAAMENKCLLDEKSRSKELYIYSQNPSFGGTYYEKMASCELTLDEDENPPTPLLDSSTIDKIFFLAAHGLTPRQMIRLGVKLVENETPDEIRSAPPGINRAIELMFTQFVVKLFQALVIRTQNSYNTTIIKGCVAASLDNTTEEFDRFHNGVRVVVAQGVVDQVLIKCICRVDLIAALICEFLPTTWIISTNPLTYCIEDISDSEFEEEDDDEEDSSDNDDDSLSDNPDDDDDDEEDEDAVIDAINQALLEKLKQKQSDSNPLISAFEQEDIKDVDMNVQRIYEQIGLSTLCPPPTARFDSYVNMTVPTLHCVPACLVARRLTDFLKNSNSWGGYQLEDNIPLFLSGIIDKWLVHQTRKLLQQIDLDRSLGSLTMLIPRRAED